MSSKICSKCLTNKHRESPMKRRETPMRNIIKEEQEEALLWEKFQEGEKRKQLDELPWSTLPSASENQHLWKFYLLMNLNMAWFLHELKKPTRRTPNELLSRISELQPGFWVSREYKRKTNLKNYNFSSLNFSSNNYWKTLTIWV